MKKAENTSKLVQMAFTLAPFHRKALDKLIEEQGFISYSDIVRQALNSFYQSYYPPYRNPSPAGELKKRKLKEIEVVDELTDHEYADVNLRPVFVSTAEGLEYAVLHDGFNGIVIVPVEGIKKWVEDHEYEVNTHNNQLRQGKVMSVDRLSTTPMFMKKLQALEIVL